MSEQGEMFELTPADIDVLNHAIDIEVRDKWRESLAGMLDVAAAALRQKGFDHDEASALAAFVMHALAIYHGGRHFYLPKNGYLEKAIRDRQLFHAWMRGEQDPWQLADEHGVTYTRVMQVIQEQRGLWRKKHEPQLPGFDDE